MQTGHSQLGRYKARRQMVISEESEAEAIKPKSQLVEFWLVREYCEMGSVSVSITITLKPIDPKPMFHQCSSTLRVISSAM